VFGRVRRHASLCAFEVGMAWVSTCNMLSRFTLVNNPFAFMLVFF
jgi:hypothetical protein